MFYCWALRVLLLWGHLARAGVGCWRGQCGTQHNPTLQDGGFQLGKGSHLGQAVKTPHTTQLKSYVALGFCHLLQKVETEQVLIAKSYFKKISVSFVQRQIPSELLQGWDTGKVPRQRTPTSNKTQYVND